MTACCPHCGKDLPAAPAPRRGGLTAQQQALFDFIEPRILETKIAPTYAEMCEALGLRSKSGICRLLDGLEDRGFIRRVPLLNGYAARGIELVERRP